MSLSRRTFLTSGTNAATAWAVAGSLPFIPGKILAASLSPDGPRSNRADRWDTSLRVEPNTIRALAMRAIETARQRGGTYADVRLTRTVEQFLVFGSTIVAQATDTELFAVGVRALVDGHWGFASSPYWELDEMSALATEAVAQARANARSSSGRAELVAAPVVTGEWIMPGIDPFTVTLEERMDVINGLRKTVSDIYDPRVLASMAQTFAGMKRQERVFASTEGAYLSQTAYETSASMRIVFRKNIPGSEQGRTMGVDFPLLGTQGKGWEYFDDRALYGRLPWLYDRGAQFLNRPERYGDIGRFDVVFDAETTGRLVAETIGRPTQLDRALGHEANATGTSYLGPSPIERLGTFQMGNSQLNVTATRSMPGGAATVQWDDEGVAPDEYALVRDGVLVDYQTTRETASLLAPWYASQGKPLRSHGCASAPNAHDLTLQHTPNLVFAPSGEASSFEDLISDTPRGIAVVGGSIDMDFQGRTGRGEGMLFEINRGKLGARLPHNLFMFETTELWKNLTARGGRSSVERVSAFCMKGEPWQQTPYTVEAVPTRVKSVSLIRA